jgi:hypothetical protein
MWNNKIEQDGSEELFISSVGMLNELNRQACHSLFKVGKQTFGGKHNHKTCPIVVTLAQLFRNGFGGGQIQITDHT